MTSIYTTFKRFIYENLIWRDILYDVIISFLLGKWKLGIEILFNHMYFIFNPYLSNLLGIIFINLYLHSNENLFVPYLNDESLNNLFELYSYLCLILNLYIAFIILINVGHALTNLSPEFKKENAKFYHILILINLICLVLVFFSFIYFTDKFITVLLEIITTKFADFILKMIGGGWSKNPFRGYGQGQPSGQGGEEPPHNPEPSRWEAYSHEPRQDKDDTLNSSQQNNLQQQYYNLQPNLNNSGYSSLGSNNPHLNNKLPTNTHSNQLQPTNTHFNNQQPANTHFNDPAATYFNDQELTNFSYSFYNNMSLPQNTNVSENTNSLFESETDFSENPNHIMFESETDFSESLMNFMFKPLPGFSETTNSSDPHTDFTAYNSNSLTYHDYAPSSEHESNLAKNTNNPMSEDYANLDKDNNSHEVRKDNPNSPGEDSTNVNLNSEESLDKVKEKLATNYYIKTARKDMTPAERENYNEYSKLRKRISRAAQSKEKKSKVLEMANEQRRLRSKITSENETPEEKRIRLSERNEKIRLTKEARKAECTPEEWEEKKAKVSESNKSRKRKFFETETEEQKEVRLAKGREYVKRRLLTETEEEKEARLIQTRLRQKAWRDNQTPEQREKRLEKKRESNQRKKSSNTSTEK